MVVLHRQADAQANGEAQDQDDGGDERLHLPVARARLRQQTTKDCCHGLARARDLPDQRSLSRIDMPPRKPRRARVCGINGLSSLSSSSCARRVFYSVSWPQRC